MVTFWTVLRFCSLLYHKTKFCEKFSLSLPSLSRQAFIVLCVAEISQEMMIILRNFTVCQARVVRIAELFSHQ